MWGEAISDHSEAVPFRRVELKPVGKSLNPSGLSDSDHAIFRGMDWTDGLIGPFVLTCTGPQCRTLGVPGESRAFGNAVRIARFHVRKSFENFFRMQRRLKPRNLFIFPQKTNLSRP